MQTVMDRVGDSVRELEQLHTQVESSHLNSLSEREKSAYDRDQQLKGGCARRCVRQVLRHDCIYTLFFLFYIFYFFFYM